MAEMPTSVSDDLKSILVDLEVLKLADIPVDETIKKAERAIGKIARIRCEAIGELDGL